MSIQYVEHKTISDRMEKKSALHKEEKKHAESMKYKKG